MPIAIRLRDDFNADDVRTAAARCKDADQYRRLLAIAAIYDGKLRHQAARVGEMDRQTLCDHVHRFNAEGPDGLINRRPPGMPAKLNAANKAALALIVEQGPDPAEHGIVRWRCCDLQAVVEQRFGVRLSEVTIGRILRDLGFSHVSARPQHPNQDEEAIEAFKKTSQPSWQKPQPISIGQQV